MKEIQGSGVALITCFNNDLSIDYDSMDKLLSHVILGGVDYLVLLGTTGESVTLSKKEKNDLIKFVRRKYTEIPIVIGIGGNSTGDIIQEIKETDFEGIDAILSVSPYYNKPSQDGLYYHFISIANSVTEMPIYLYNIPGRSVVNINPETMKKLSKIKNIVGVKDATSDLSLPLETKMNCGSNFDQLSGEDATFLSFLVSGGIGCISVTANVIPKLCSNLYKCWIDRKLDEAMRINDLIYPLNKVLFTETSPSPVKYALSLMGKCENELRLPMVNVNSTTEDLIYNVMHSLSLIK